MQTFVYNIDNLLGEKLIVSFSAKKLDSKSLKIFDDENVFIFNTKFSNEIDLLDEKYASELCHEFQEIFKLTKAICSKLLEDGKKGKFVFLTVNSSLANVSNFPAAPIRDEAIHSFVKSLAKEMSSFGIIFNVLCIDPIFEMFDINELKLYRKNMKSFSSQKSPMKLEDVVELIKHIISSDSTLLSGMVYSHQ